MSGGRATVARSRGEHVRQAGDITAVAPEGHALTDKLYVELKFYKNLEIQNFFVRQIGMLARFWEKTVEEADSYKRTPVLIAKQDRVPTLLLTTCGEYCPELEAFVMRPALLFKAKVATVYFAGSICTVYRLDDVLSLAYRKPSRRVRVC